MLLTSSPMGEPDSVWRSVARDPSQAGARLRVYYAILRKQLDMDKPLDMSSQI